MNACKYLGGALSWPRSKRKQHDMYVCACVCVCANMYAYKYANMSSPALAMKHKALSARVCLCPHPIGQSWTYLSLNHNTPFSREIFYFTPRINTFCQATAHSPPTRPTITPPLPPLPIPTSSPIPKPTLTPTPIQTQTYTHKFTPRPVPYPHPHPHPYPNPHQHPHPPLSNHTNAHLLTNPYPHPHPPSCTQTDTPTHLSGLREGQSGHADCHEHIKNFKHGQPDHV